MKWYNHGINHDNSVIFQTNGLTSLTMCWGIITDKQPDPEEEALGGRWLSSNNSESCCGLTILHQLLQTA